MKTKLIPFLFVLLFIACSKEKNNQHQQLHSFNQNNVFAYPDSADLPLNDLGTGQFLGYTGGLYPDGSNIASGNYANDLLAVSKSITPLDTFGNPSSTSKSKILFISLGGSTGGKNMTALRAKTINNPATNSALKLLSCDQPGFDAYLNAIADSNNAYWDHVTQIIIGNKSSYRQVQVIYLETDDSTREVAFPDRPTIVKDDIERCLRTIKQKFVNIKVVYVLARTRTFGKKTPANNEPSPYYFGWACKWAIEDQINGVPGTKYKGNNAVAPMLAWGFYQWAITTPRKTDGFYWLPSETSDGLHASAEGQDTLSTRFQNFLLTDKFASKWYAAH